MGKPVIIILGKIPPPYMGPAIATQILLNSSLRDDFELVHVDTRAYDQLTDIGKFNLDKVKRNFRIYKDLVQKIRNRKPELVLIPISQSTAGFIKDSIFILIATFLGKKTLLHLRGSDFRRWFEQAGALTQIYTRWVLGRCQGVIVLGHNLKALFNGLFPEENIFVAPNGGDYTIPARNRVIDNKVHLLYLGNLQPSKGVEDVIEAAALLQSSHPDQFTLDVIGAWRKEATKKYCLDLVQQSALPVTFHPQEASKNKFQFLKNADVFLFPPREPEGHPWVIVEAMACGLPVISTDRGAIVESVTDGSNGYIVEGHNAKAIAEKVSLLISDPALRMNMGKASRARYELDFTEKRMTERLRTIFFTVIRNK